MIFFVLSVYVMLVFRKDDECVPFCLPPSSSSLLLCVFAELHNIKYHTLESVSDATYSSLMAPWIVLVRRILLIVSSSRSLDSSPFIYNIKN